MIAEPVDRIKPIIDSTYPALMAGLCLTFLSISPDALKTKWLMFFVSIASLSFIISSISLFKYSLNTVVGKKTDENKSPKDEYPLSWKIAKWTFLLGIILLLISTTVVVYNLWIHEFSPSITSYFSEPSNITDFKKSTNLTVVSYSLPSISN